MTVDTAHLLEFRDLEVDFFTRSGTARAVRGASLHIDAGEALGLVGESASGKSTAALAALGLIDLPGKIVGGEILWKGESLRDPSLARQVRGKELSVVFQDPMTSLFPLLTVGTQITDVLRRHLNMSSTAAMERARELLDLVGIPDPDRRLRQYPFEFSGGMQQRVLIAIALACNPQLLIADEPTTALDVTIQAQIIDLLVSLRETLDLAVLLITHDLGVIARICSRVAVMYAGRIVEIGPVDEVFLDPRHPYSEALVAAAPRLDRRTRRLETIDGVPPDPRNPFPGCAFYPRCPSRAEHCRETSPRLEPAGPDRVVSCHLPLEPSDHNE